MRSSMAICTDKLAYHVIFRGYPTRRGMRAATTRMEKLCGYAVVSDCDAKFIGHDTDHTRRVGYIYFVKADSFSRVVGSVSHEIRHAVDDFMKYRGFLLRRNVVTGKEAAAWMQGGLAEEFDRWARCYRYDIDRFCTAEHYAEIWPSAYWKPIKKKG